MEILRGRAMRLYLWGLGGTLLGAWLTGITSSMVPLALGASASILCTTLLVKAILTAARRRSRPDR